MTRIRVAKLAGHLFFSGWVGLGLECFRELLGLVLRLPPPAKQVPDCFFILHAGGRVDRLPAGGRRGRSTRRTGLLVDPSVSTEFAAERIVCGAADGVAGRDGEGGGDEEQATMLRFMVFSGWWGFPVRLMGAPHFAPSP